MVLLACLQRDGRRPPGGRITVAVAVVACAILIGHLVVIGERDDGELHDVRSCGEPIEEVEAVCIGDGGIEESAAAVEQKHRDAGNSGFAGVLHTVPVVVEPDEVPDLTEG